METGSFSNVIGYTSFGISNIKNLNRSIINYANSHGVLLHTSIKRSKNLIYEDGWSSIKNTIDSGNITIMLTGFDGHHLRALSDGDSGHTLTLSGNSELSKQDTEIAEKTQP